MPIGNVEWPNKIHYVDCHGRHRFVPGLPLNKRMEWLHLFREFHALRLELTAKHPDLLFRQFYDEFNPDFSGNEYYSPEFKTLADTLLSLHGIDPGSVSAEMAVVFLIGDKSQDQSPVLLTLEFPEKEQDESNENIPEGIDPEAYLRASLTQYAGSANDANELIENRPYIELLEEVTAYSKLIEQQSKDKGKQKKAKQSLDFDAPLPRSKDKNPSPQSKEEALATMAKMKALFEQDRLSVYATPAILPGMDSETVQE